MPTSPSHCLPSDTLPKRCVPSQVLSVAPWQPIPLHFVFFLFWTTSRVWTTVFTSLFHIQPVSKLFKNRNHGFYFWTSAGKQAQSGWCWVSAQVRARFFNQVRCPKRFLLEKLWVAETQVRGKCSFLRTCHNVALIALWSVSHFLSVTLVSLVCKMWSTIL